MTKLLIALIALAVPPAPAQNPPPPVANHGGSPAVSPDGAWIAFNSDRDGRPEIYVIRPDGTGERQVTQSATSKGGLRWTSDGRGLLFSAFTNGTTHFFRVDLDGSNEREIFSVAGRDPRLSPDGRRVIYGAGSFTATDFMLAAVDGATIQNPRRLDVGSPIAWNAEWSSDGRMIAFTGRNQSADLLEVWLVNADGSESRPLTAVTSADGGAQVPRWSRDGGSIAFQGGGSISIVDVATRRTTKLLPHTERYRDETPSWFPDGKRLAFQSDRTGRWEVWTVNVDGTGLKQLTK